jgi:hypothetical protein
MNIQTRPCGGQDFRSLDEKVLLPGRPNCDRARCNIDTNAEIDAVDTCLATAAATAAVAIATGARSASPAIKVDRVAFTLAPCPFVATAGGLLLTLRW